MLDFHCSSSRKSKLFLPLILFTAGLLTTLLQAVFMVIFIHKGAKWGEWPDSVLQYDSLHYCVSCSVFD